MYLASGAFSFGTSWRNYPDPNNDSERDQSESKRDNPLKHMTLPNTIKELYSHTYHTVLNETVAVIHGGQVFIFPSLTSRYALAVFTKRYSNMATIINNPGDGNDNGAAGWVIAVVLIVVVVLLLLFLWPRLNGTTNTTVINPPQTTDTTGTGDGTANGTSPILNTNTTVNSTTTSTTTR
jgi:hypothetical protein